MAKRSRKQVDQTLLKALAAGGTVEAAALKAGVTDRTVYRRLEDPAFSAQLEQMKADMVQRIARQLTTAGFVSAKTLVDLQRDPSVPAAVRRGAARDVLELGMKYRESDDFEQRLSALEGMLPRGKEPAIGDAGSDSVLTAAPEAKNAPGV